MRKQILKNERGAALLETAITIPIILLISVGIFEFGRAYQTWQVLTNAAREGARIAILSDTTDADVTAAVQNYMNGGRLTNVQDSTINVERNVDVNGRSSSRITVNYPFSFMVLNPVVRLVDGQSGVGAAPLTMQSVALMRNEG